MIFFKTLFIRLASMPMPFLWCPSFTLSLVQISWNLDVLLKNLINYSKGVHRSWCHYIDARLPPDLWYKFHEMLTYFWNISFIIQKVGIDADAILLMPVGHPIFGTNFMRYWRVLKNMINYSFCWHWCRYNF